MKWRVYRLPGSRQWWHIDTGPGTLVVNCLGFMSDVPLRTINGPGDQVPRAWVEVEGNLFVGPSGYARFMAETATLLPCNAPLPEEKPLPVDLQILKKVAEPEVD